MTDDLESVDRSIPWWRITVPSFAQWPQTNINAVSPRIPGKAVTRDGKPRKAVKNPFLYVLCKYGQEAIAFETRADMIDWYGKNIPESLESLVEKGTFRDWQIFQVPKTTPYKIVFYHKDDEKYYRDWEALGVRFGRSPGGLQKSFYKGIVKELERVFYTVYKRA